MKKYRIEFEVRKIYRIEVYASSESSAEDEAERIFEMHDNASYPYQCLDTDFEILEIDAC